MLSEDNWRHLVPTASLPPLDYSRWLVLLTLNLLEQPLTGPLDRLEEQTPTLTFLSILILPATQLLVPLSPMLVHSFLLRLLLTYTAGVRTLWLLLSINVYSFALRPEEHQPSGTCNFSRIDNAVLQLVLSAGTVQGTATAKVRVYAVNYNVLRVMSGMAGIKQMIQIVFELLLRKYLNTLNGAEKQCATNKQAMFVDNFALTPAVLVSC